MSARERRAKSRRQQRRVTSRRAILPVAVSGAMATATALGLAGELATANAANLTASQVADINPSGNGTPSGLTDVGGTLYFSANDGTHGTELWKSDGTSAGTVQVADIYPGSTTYGGNTTPNSSDPHDLTNVGGTLYFVANDGTHGDELWKSDGTSAGTVLVADINPGSTTYYGTTIPNSSDPHDLTNVGGTLYFVANDGTHGEELWKSDGTSAGTVQVADIDPGPGGNGPRDLTDVNGTLYFVANDGTHGYELWTSDGTSSGTVQVADINPGPGNSLPRYLTDVGGTLYFEASDGTHGVELWKSDGTSSGTTQVADINPGPGNSFPHQLTDVGGTLYFAASDGTHGTELWKSDGTSTGTTQVADINPGNAYYGSNPFNFTDVGGTLYFSANDGTHGYELWKSDGTSAGTVQVADINPGPGESSPSDLTNAGGTLYLIANDGAHGPEVWQSDGTGAGTVPVPGGDMNPDNLTNVEGSLYFSANDGTHGIELWKLGPAPPGGGGGGQTGTTMGSPSSSRDPSMTGRPVTFTVTISPIPDGGTVKFTDRGVTIPGCGAAPVSTTTGRASCTTTFNTPGSHSIEAIYTGDSGFSGSQSPVRTELVKRATCRVNTLTYHFYPPPGKHETRAWVYIDGKLRYTVRRQSFLKVTIPRPRLANFSVRVVNQLSSGVEFQRTADYRGCTLAHLTLTQLRKRPAGNA